MESFVIGVAGGSGAGKTTLAEGLADHMNPGHAVVIHEDRYYRDNSHLPAASRGNLNYDHPDAIDLRLLSEHVRELVAGGRITQPVYDFVQHVRTGETITVFPAKLLIVEGLFTLFNRFLRDVIELDDRERLSRRIERDTKERARTQESVIWQWESTVQPMHKMFVQPSRSFADLILSGDDPVDRNIAKIRDFFISKNGGKDLFDEI